MDHHMAMALMLALHQCDQEVDSVDEGKQNK